jgi:predicted HTH transcriptional regulator
VILDGDLRARLRDREDGWTERKSKGVNTEDITKTVVAFANSLPDGHQGILFIGIADKSGDVEGVDDTESLQKRVRYAAEKRVYPPIFLGHNCRVINEDGKQVVAVIVEASKNRPHFAGPAYVRVGSESIEASEQQFTMLIASRTEVARLIIDAWQNDEIVLVELLKHRHDKPRFQCKVTGCNTHFARFKSVTGGDALSGSLLKITASYVDQMEMIMFTINEN